MTDKNRIFSKVERMACECVSAVTNRTISEADIYSGRTKTTLGVSVARQMAMLYMHDHYGINYRRIAERARISEKSAIRCVRKARIFRFSDPLYRDVYKLMDEKL